MITSGNSSSTNDSLSNSNDVLLDLYRKRFVSSKINYDSHQEAVLEDLQKIYNHIIKPQTKEAQKLSFLRLFSRKADKTQPKQTQKGLYLWGGVGRGKTHLVDMFFEQLPIKNKLRLHFHRFMQLVHEELGVLDGEEDSLKHVAGNFSKQTRLLCLDELHVIDITDAMLLGRLFQYLFDAGIILVTTSNFHPDELYKNGLQRSRFLPAIELLKKHTKVTEMTGYVNYEETGEGRFCESKKDRF